MKCVRLVGQGVPVRMSDEEAFQIVERDKDGEYCSKSFWKDWWDRGAMTRLYGTRPSKDRP